MFSHSRSLKKNDTFVEEDNRYTDGMGIPIGQTGFSEISRNPTHGGILKVTERHPTVTEEDRLRDILHRLPDLTSLSAVATKLECATC